MEPEIAQMSSSSIESQKHTIGQLLKTILNKGDEWYLVDIRWFKQWKKYVGFDSWDMYNVGERSLYPGPIDNSGLFSDQETQALKEHLIDELDYVLVPTEAWNKLVSWYGCFEGQRPIVRKVIVHGLFVKHCKVEVYLLELKLCENHNMENVVTWHFSRGDTIETIEKEMRTLFSIPSEKETRLWNKYMSNKYEQLTNPQSTVQDAGLFQGQLIMIEHNKKDGLCTTQASNLNATPAGKLTPYLKLSSNPPVSLSPTGNGSSSSNRTKTFGISSKFQEKEQAEEVETNNMVLPVKQSNPCTSTAETFHSRKTEGAAQKSCLLPLNQFWYMSHTNKEGIKQIERKNKIKMVAQVHVTFEAEQKDGNPHEALSEFIDLSQSCSADSGQSVIPLKFVDPDQWSDALKVIKRNKDKILLTMSSEEVIVSGPKQSQDEFSAVLNAMQKTNTPAEQHKPALDDTSLRRINLTVNQQTKSPTVENNKQLKKSDEKQEGTINHQTKSPTVENIREPRLTSVQGTNVKAKSDLNVESSNSKNKQSLQTSRAKSFLESYRVKKKYFKHPLRLARHSDTTGLGGLPRKSSCENERKEDSSEPSLIPPTAQQNAEASTKKGASGDRKDDLCPICLGQLTKQKQLRCKHKFCDECLQESLKRTGPMCPVCKDVFGVMEGDQPDGVMTWSCNSSPLPGFSGCGSIVIAYTFPNGKQTEKHPNPGQPYQGTTRTAYLPDNEEGQEVLKLLKKAFDQKMIFTVGTSRTSGLDNQVIWNDISHKTSKTGGPQRFGYPDPNYLRKVKEDLKTKGIE